MAIDPQETSSAVRTAADYGDVLLRLWPIAMIGGTIGVIFHQRAIFATPHWGKRIGLTLSEWSFGASAAMLASLLYPLLASALPGGITLGIEVEIGLCGFVGGSLGKGLFRVCARRFFGMDLRHKDDG